MAAAALTSRFSDTPGRADRSRVVAALLALAIVALVFWVLVSMGLIDLDRGNSGAGALTSIHIGAAPKAAQAKAKAKAARAPLKQAAATPVRVPPTAVKTAPLAKPTPAFIHLSNDDLAASDISKLPRAAAGSGAAAAAGGSYGPGEGPGGQHLFNVRWYREPSPAEIGPYAPHDLPPAGWADISCRMIEHYHVENCQELSESPPGSGMARALRRAAWQFLVRPPSVNGEAKIGTWVRIHYVWSSSRRGDEPDAATETTNEQR